MVETYIKEKWTERQVLSLPFGEHNFFERKGQGFMSKTWNDFEQAFAKALSAFANSGGGHIIIGQENNCAITGIDRFYAGKNQKGKQPIREWFENIVPNLLMYPLRDFRVHEVKTSTLPKDKILIVVDVGDSKLAPHQTNIKSDVNLYYQRYGGHSVPANHHSIAQLFGRSRFPSREVAGSWLQVVNGLIDYLESESHDLQNKRRLWKPDRSHFFYGRIPPFKSLFESSRLIFSPDISEQFLDFNESLEKLLRDHDELITQIREQFKLMHQAIGEDLSFRKCFDEATSMSNLSKIVDSEYEFRDVKPEALFSRIFFGKNRRSPETIAYVKVLTINKHSMVGDNGNFEIFWNSERHRFFALLRSGLLQDFDRAIDRGYAGVRKLNRKIISRLKEKRKELSIEHGIPVRQH